MIPTITAGIDISAKTLDCTVYNGADACFSATSHFMNDVAGIPQLLTTIPADAAIVVEPTGRYGHELIRIAGEMDRAVLLAPNREAKLFLRSENLRVKNDGIDSRGLARFGAQKVLRPYVLNSPDVEKMVQLLAVRRQLAATIASFSLQGQSLRMVSHQIEEVLADLKHRLAEIDADIAAAGQAEELAIIPRLMKVPGVGRITASAVATRLATKKFISSDAFVAYCGLDVTVVQSGQSNARGRLTKHGDAELRRLFYCGAQSVMRCKSGPFRDLYDREKAKGTPHTRAVCIIARKLARICWSIVAHNETFDPDRVLTRPTDDPSIAQALAEKPLDRRSLTEQGQSGDRRENIT